MNAESLLKRIKRGQRLAENELDFVRRALADRTTPEDKYTLIHVLWKARGSQSKSLIWENLADPDDMVRRIALQAISELHPSGEVFEATLRAVRDPSKYVRMAAATSLGNLGALLRDRAAEAAALLLQRFDQQSNEHDSEWEAYYEGLLNLLQIPVHMRPLATSALRKADINPDVISAARDLASGG